MNAFSLDSFCFCLFVLSVFLMLYWFIIWFALRVEFLYLFAGLAVYRQLVKNEELPSSCFSLRLGREGELLRVYRHLLYLCCCSSLAAVAAAAFAAV